MRDFVMGHSLFHLISSTSRVNISIHIKDTLYELRQAWILMHELSSLEFSSAKIA